MLGRGRQGRVQVRELQVLLRGSATGGCSTTRATCSVRVRATVRACCPLGSLRWLLVVARSGESWAWAALPGQRVGNMLIAVVWSGVATQFVVQPSQGKQATPHPSPCAVMRSYVGSRLRALPPEGGGSQVDLGSVWIWCLLWCLQLWFSVQARLLNAQ